MTAAGTSITVVGPRGAADLTLPAQVPLVILLPDIVALLAPQAAGLAPATWRLRRSLGGDLNPHGTLAANQVSEGAVLVLADDPRTEPTPVVRDLTEAVEDAADRGRRWSPAATRGAAAGLAGVGLLAATLGWTLARPPEWAATGAFGAVALGLVLFIRAARTRLERPAVLALGWTALVVAAVVGCAAGRAADQPASVVLALGGGALLLASVLLAVLAPGLRTAVATAAPIGVLAGAAGLAADLGATGADVAAVLAAGVPFLFGLVPGLSTAAAGVLGLPDTVAGAAVEVSEKVAAARRYAAALLCGLTVPLAIALILLTRQPGHGYPLLLAAVVTLELLLAARSYSAVPHVLPLLFAAATGLLAIQAHLLAQPGTERLVGTVVAGALLVIAAAGALVRLPQTVRSQLKPWLDRAELLTLAAAPLLVLGVLGVYHALADRLG